MLAAGRVGAPAAPGGDEDPAARALRDWLGLQLEAFREKVQALVLPGGGANPDAPGGVAGAALTGWMETLRVAGGHLDAPAFRGMLLRLAAGGPGEEGGRGAVDPRVLALLREKYLTRFADVRYAAWKAVRSLAREGDARPGLEESLSHGLYRLLLALGPPGDSGGGSPSFGPEPRGGRGAEDEEGEGEDAAALASKRRKLGVQKWAKPAQHHLAFGEAWTALLKRPLPADLYEEVLVTAAELALPNMANPLLLSEFFVRSIDRGAYTGALALHGVFLLVTRHGLEYPAFYTRLYGLVRPEILRARNRKKFLRLLDKFLKSALVPAYVVAAFAKRLARLAIGASPAGALLCLAFVHNLLRRHPPCLIMLHRPAAGPADGGGASDPAGPAAVAATSSDPYDGAAEDPAEANALESSLWEVETLRRHYNPDVARFVEVFDRDFTNRKKFSEIDLEPLLNEGYTSMLRHEIQRRPKNTALAFYREPLLSLFPSAEEGPGRVGGDSDAGIASGHA